MEDLAVEVRVENGAAYETFVIDVDGKDIRSFSDMTGSLRKRSPPREYACPQQSTRMGISLKSRSVW